MNNDHHVAAWQRIAAANGHTGGFSLTTVCRACADDVDADFAGATLVLAGELRLLAAATDERARLVEDAQLVTGEGPCTDAYTHRAPAEAADLHHTAARWPAYTPIAREQGARSVLALPLTVATLPIGAMDLYRRQPVPFTPAQKDRAAAYARILALLALDEHPHLVVHQPQAPHPARRGPQGYPPTVHIAAGILAEKHQLTPDDALARLRAHAFRHSQTLLHTAQHVLDHHRLD
ncbi:GAF and ANTAR domain-containing protein [Streptomyces monomycini]|uniref:GAF and ANTAR domain-containing protein n=1 Tax=Streptomyces monomycini TaxID=371720 RepID=UPI00067C4E61|nr:GAF and ANTAR domain-containing protein [Streptomyces monomycini]